MVIHEVKVTKSGDWEPSAIAWVWGQGWQSERPQGTQFHGLLFWVDHRAWLVPFWMDSLTHLIYNNSSPLPFQRNVPCPSSQRPRAGASHEQQSVDCWNMCVLFVLAPESQRYQVSGTKDTSERQFNLWKERDPKLVLTVSAQAKQMN